MNFIGIDLGTTSIKAAVFDETGRRLALRSVEYTLDTGTPGFVEFPAGWYVDICRELIDSLAAEHPVAALAVDSQGETLVLADGEGTPLCPAVNWTDIRAVTEAGMIEEKFGRRRVYEVTGQPEITGGWPASKLLWFRRNRPDIFSRTKKIFLLEDWIIYKLCGAFVSESTLQSSTIYFDIRRRCWWDEMLDFIGVSRSMLPEIVPCGSIVGKYNGILVVTGALDQIAGSLGAGVVSLGNLSEMTGTIMAICAPCSEIPAYNPNSIIPCHLHALDGMYCRLLWSSAAGAAYKWFRDEFCPGLSYGELDEMASAVPPGCEGLTFLPHLFGSVIPVNNPAARGAFYGITTAHTRAHFVRAILESVAFMLKSYLDYIGFAGEGELRITGGGANGTLWPQIKADVTGYRLASLSESECACLGAAMLAGLGTGAYGSLKEAAAGAVKVKRVFEPSGVDYDMAYKAFIELDKKLNWGCLHG